MVDYFSELESEINKGLTEEPIDMGFERLTNNVGLRKSTYYLIGGYTGSLKTATVDAAFILNPHQWVSSSSNTTGVKLKVFYFSMERKRVLKMAKFIAQKVFKEHGFIFSVSKIMGWLSKTYKLKPNEHDLIKLYKDWINHLLNEVVTIIDAPINPMGIKKTIDEYAKNHGKVEKLDSHNSIYIPNNPKELVLVIYDHIGLQKRESRTKDGVKHQFNSKKEIIDQSSEDARKFRDFYGYSIIKVSQFNRSIANPMRIKNGDVEPQLEDFKESSNTVEDADVVFSLFDPWRYNVPDPSGYDLTRLRDENGVKKYRSLKVLKNSYGSDDLRIGLAVEPITGTFKEMKKLSEMTNSDYTNIINNSYFL